MSTTARVILCLVLIAVAGAGGFWIGRHGGAKEEEHESAATQPEEDEKAVAIVIVAPVREGKISDEITVYGSVIADPGEVRVLSVPFESRIGKVMVTPGQEVAADTEVMQAEASPDTRVALQDAKNAVEAATRDLEQTQQRFKEQLATNQELSQAQQTVAGAKLKLQSLLERGVDKTTHLKSPMAGVISKIDVQEGQIVAPGAAMIEIAGQNRIQVRLGVDASDASLLKPGQSVKLRRVEGSGDDIEGKIRLIGKRVDPTSRLVDVLVTLPPDAHLLLETFVTGRLTRETATGLIVPRQALLAEEDGAFAIFTVADGHAHKHDAHVKIETKREAHITADELKAGDLVAIVGNLELEDGMQVETKAQPTTNAASEPATSPAKPEAP